MDPRLLRHYNLELQHLREMGAEFAQQFPRIAARLGMNGLEVADPYVERLLEGVAFMAARVQLKLEAEFPRFTQALLELIYPHYLAPTPSMLVAQLRPDVADPNLAAGLCVPRGSVMHGPLAGDDPTACEFRTAHEVTLWPIEVTGVRYFTFAPDLPLNALPVAQRIKGGVRISLKTADELQFAQLPLDRLDVFLTGRSDVANKLYELCLGSALGVLVLPSRRPGGWSEFLPASAVRPLGFADEQALLPVTRRGFQGYRLLQEYFSFPERYRFVDLTGLAPAMARAETNEIEVVILLGRGDASLETMVDGSNVALFCTPAINLFPKRADRIHLGSDAYEYHVVADRTRPLDFEIHEVTNVVGHGTGTDYERRFQPFYSYDGDQTHQHDAYFTVRREPRLIGSAETRRGSRSSYAGSEVFVALVDPQQAPFSDDLRQLSIQTLCTNRDLVLQMPVGIGRTDLSLDVAAPVGAIRVVAGPSRPYGPLAEGAVSWRVVSHLSLNYLSLVDAGSSQAAIALRELLALYAPEAHATARRQIDGIRSVSVARVVRRLPSVAGPLAFGRGLEITVGVDELAFEGGSAYLLGALLGQFLARHVSINSFTETVLRSDERGEISRWMPQWGARPTL